MGPCCMEFSPCRSISFFGPLNLIDNHRLGKGITDQDRNILSNQLLVLDFLRSAAHILKRGHIPSISTLRKKKKLDDDDDDDGKGIGTTSTDLEDSLADESITTRGTVLITLRNVVPYTQW